MNPIHQLIEASVEREKVTRELDWMIANMLKPHIKEGGAFWRKAEVQTWPIHYMNPFKQSWS